MLTPDLIPVRRPHFELRANRFYFLLSRRAQSVCEPADGQLWDRLDGRTSVGALRHIIPDAGERILRMHELGLCELTAPGFPTGRRRVLVLEPHMDDAVLSVGGLMWRLRESHEFTLVSMVGRTNFTSYYYLDREFFDVERVTALRLAESALVMRLLGGRHETLGLVDAPLRYHPGNWTLDWYRRNHKPVGAFMGHSPGPPEVESWAAVIRDCLVGVPAEEWWLPLGVGVHVDHELTRDACLRALSRMEGVSSRPALYFYPEVPYSVHAPEHAGEIVGALMAAGARLTRQVEDVSGVFEHKLRLSSVYSSQFKPRFMEPLLLAAARRSSPSGHGLCELRYRVDAMPGPVAQAAVYSGAPAVRLLTPRVAAWHARHRSAAQIRLVSPTPLGRWAEDMSALLAHFPRAHFEVWISSECADDSDRLTSPRIRIHLVPPASRWWARVLVGLAASRPAPTILLLGNRHALLAKAIRSLLLRSDPLVAARADHLLHALRELPEEDPRRGGP